MTLAPSASASAQDRTADAERGADGLRLCSSEVATAAPYGDPMGTSRTSTGSNALTLPGIGGNPAPGGQDCSEPAFEVASRSRAVGFPSSRPFAAPGATVGESLKECPCKAIGSRVEFRLAGCGNRDRVRAAVGYFLTAERLG